MRLIAFDVEGTLVEDKSSWVELHKRFGTWDKGKEYADLFFSGKIDYAEWAELDASLWKGRRKEEILEWADSVRYREYAFALMDFLRENGFKIALLSSGLMCLAGRVARELGADYVYANELVFKDGRVAGVVPKVDFEGKGAILRRLKGELKPALTVAVGDGFNDISMFREADVAIAIDPHEGVEGDHNVGSLQEVEEIIREILKEKSA